jgi:hypothetical protein
VLPPATPQRCPNRFIRPAREANTYRRRKILRRPILKGAIIRGAPHAALR